MATVKPYPLQKVSSQRVNLYNRLFQKDPGLAFQMGTDTYTLCLAPHENGDAARAKPPAHLRINDQVGFALFPEERLLASLLEDVISIEAFFRLPQKIRAIALEAALETAMTQIDHLLGTRSHLEGDADNLLAEACTEAVGLQLVRKTDGSRFRCTLRGDRKSMAWLASRLGRLPGRIAHPFGHLPVAFPLEVACGEVTIDQVRHLEPLDMIMAEKSGGLYDREIRIGCGCHWSLIGKTLPPDRFVVEKITTIGEKIMNKSSIQTTTASPADISVADIPVALDFELGQIQLTMGELQRLQPGYIFQLPTPPDMDRPVTIKANGVAIGTGELVMIDDHLGVRIHHLVDDGSPVTPS